MKAAGYALAGGVVSAVAFPRIGPGWLILPGIALFLYAVRSAPTARIGLLVGGIYGVSFFSGLLWWIGELGLIAVIPLVLVQAAFMTLYAWWLSRHNGLGPWPWFLLAVGGWSLMEVVRYRFPFDGFEWGGAGYAVSDQAWARALAPLYGTSGVTVLVVMVAAALVFLVKKPTTPLLSIPIALLVVFLGWNWWGRPVSQDPVGVEVAIVQGSTPCPFEHCPDERLQTFQQHLELTRQIEPGSVGLVVWSEGSTGSTNADPVLNPEVGAAIGAEARRIGAWILVGSDRPVNDEEWVNANVMFDPEGEIVGEYRKQHPVPFGEYIPFRPLFEWIPALDQVPRDMIPGDGPVVFDTGSLQVGSVISFEGSFARYPRQAVDQGANVIVVATNEGSYGTTPGSDQFIGMTRMRAAELGLDVIHSAVTGRSTIISSTGVPGEISGLGTEEIIYGVVSPRPASVYARLGDCLMIVAAVAGVATWWWARPLVGSVVRPEEKE
ncbi:MAG: apolipoprotein N-acyltransferase [Acidimicrobiia bacterium]